MTARTVMLIAIALAMSIGADLLVGAAVPGRMAVFSLAAAVVLVLGAKALGAAGLTVPAGTRTGEHESSFDERAIEDRDG